MRQKEVVAPKIDYVFVVMVLQGSKNLQEG
jgi:hypothetical protein